jgi:hypothetical protein
MGAKVREKEGFYWVSMKLGRLGGADDPSRGPAKLD